MLRLETVLLWCPFKALRPTPIGSLLLRPFHAPGPCLFISDPGHHHCQLRSQRRPCYCYLAHEGWNHPVEGGAFVAKALLTSAQGSEVL